MESLSFFSWLIGRNFIHGDFVYEIKERYVEDGMRYMNATVLFNDNSMYHLLLRSVAEYDNFPNVPLYELTVIDYYVDYDS